MKERINVVKLCIERESSYYILVVVRVLFLDSSKMYKKIKIVLVIYYIFVFIFVVFFKCVLYKVNNLLMNVLVVFFGIFFVELFWNMWYDGYRRDNEYRCVLVLFFFMLCCKVIILLDF